MLRKFENDVPSKNLQLLRLSDQEVFKPCTALVVASEAAYLSHHAIVIVVIVIVIVDQQEEEDSSVSSNAPQKQPQA